MGAVLRFAPSPNGFLHLGHAYSALLNQAMARRLGGAFLLRLEDIDQTRCRAELETAMIEDLRWLGVRWDGAVWRQSARMSAYADALSRLRAMGLLYPAYESRAELARYVAAAEQRGAASWPRDPDGAPLYRRGAMGLSADEIAGRDARGAPYALRLDMMAALSRVGALSWTETGSGPGSETGQVGAAPQAWGDVVLARRDMPTSYHLAVVVDDAAQGVTHVVRGQDLFWATSVHRVLQALLGLGTPTYHHHALITDERGSKLSKSEHAPALRDLRAAGLTPAAIRQRLGFP